MSKYATSEEKITCMWCFLECTARELVHSEKTSELVPVREPPENVVRKTDKCPRCGNILSEVIYDANSLIVLDDRQSSIDTLASIYAHSIRGDIYE